MSGETVYGLITLAASVPVIAWLCYLERSGEVEKGVLFGPAICWLLALAPLTLCVCVLWFARRVCCGTAAAQGEQ